MGKKGTAHDGLDLAATLPWPWGVGLAVLSWGCLHWLAGSAVPVFHAIGWVGQWLLPPLLLVAALVSWLRARKAVALLNTTLNAEVLRALSWREFERLLYAAFEAHGFDVQDRGGHGADGGVDLVAKRGDQNYFVQCKHWKTQQVGVNVVRELAGIVATHGAAGGYVVASGTYTREAQEFGVKAGLQLLDGTSLLEFLEAGRRHRRQPHEPAVPDFAAMSARYSRRVRVMVVLAMVVAAGLWVGSRPSETAGRDYATPNALSRRSTPHTPPVSAPATVRTMPLVDPVELEMRRAESRQIADEAAKEAAWAAEWKVPPECEHPADWAAQVECGNRYIRARRVFEEAWTSRAGDDSRN